MSINTCKINDIPEKVLNDSLDVMILLSSSWFLFGLALGVLFLPVADFLIEKYIRNKYRQSNNSNP